MFGKLFRKNKHHKAQTKTPQLSPEESALQDALAKHKLKDPMAAVKFGSQDITDRLLNALKTETGVHIETALCLIGALCGYACHAAAREKFVTVGGHAPEKVFTIITDKNGKKYYYGDIPNAPLIEGELSVWALVSGMAIHLGEEEKGLLDIHALAKHTVTTIGKPEFGIPRIEGDHNPAATPISFVIDIWPVILPIINKYCDDPTQKPIIMGLAAQKIMELAKDIIAPRIATQIIMESALPMSKIGPEWLKKTQK